MVRPTLVDGDVWADNLANAAGFPRLDGEDEYGSGPKVIDDWLNDAPDQIKARFYGWFNRVIVTQGAGLDVNYTGATIVLLSGVTSTLAAGTITLAANATNYIFITGAGQVSYAPSLPGVGVALARATTNATEVTELVDLRYQTNERVVVLQEIDQGGTSPRDGFQIGDLKESGSPTPDVGWFLCDNARYNDADYPIAAAKIGRIYSLPSDPAGTFRVPPGAGRMSIGSGAGTGLTNRTAGETGGAERVAISTAQLPAHTHGATGRHSHSVNDPGHGHQILGSFETSGGNTDSIILEDAGVAGETGGEKGYTTETNSNQGPRIINTAKTGITIVEDGANITIGRTGSNQSHENMPPFFVTYKWIRLF